MKKEKKQSGMVKHNIDTLTKVKIAVATLPDTTIGQYYDMAAEKELKSQKPKPQY